MYHFPFYCCKSFQRCFHRSSLCPHYNLVKAVAGEEMVWLLVSLCSLSILCSLSDFSLFTWEVRDGSKGWWRHVYKALPWKWFQLRPLNLANQDDWLPCIELRNFVSNWFLGDILTTLCPSMWTSTGVLHVHPFSWHSTLDRNTIFHNYYPCWGSGHWGRRTLGVTWSHRDHKAYEPSTTCPLTWPQVEASGCPRNTTWHGAFLKSWLLGMFNQSEATCQPRALSEMCELQAGRTTTWNSSPTQALLLFIGAFLCLWSPEACSAGPSWGSRGGVCKEGRCHHRV